MSEAKGSMSSGSISHSDSCKEIKKYPKASHGCISPQIWLIEVQRRACPEKRHIQPKPFCDLLGLTVSRGSGGGNWSDKQKNNFPLSFEVLQTRC